MKFAPSETKNKIDAPFFESARADVAPYYNAYSNWSEAKAKSAVQSEMSKLGGSVLEFLEGKFGTEEDENGKLIGILRHGYMIKFTLNGLPGRITVAGLPIKRWTEVREKAVRIQALLVMRDWLKAQVTTMVFSPGNNPLIPHLLTPGGKTLIEMVAEQAEIDVPMLGAGIIEGEIVS